LNTEVKIESKSRPQLGELTTFPQSP